MALFQIVYMQKGARCSTCLSTIYSDGLK